MIKMKAKAKLNETASFDEHHNSYYKADNQLNISETKSIHMPKPMMKDVRRHAWGLSQQNKSSHSIQQFLEGSFSSSEDESGYAFKYK